MTRVAITGHRPERISDWTFVEHQLEMAFNDLRASTVIQGMAAGTDLVAAKVAYRAHIPFWCARPWKGHMSKMGGSQGFDSVWENYYKQALTHADRVIDVTDFEDYPGKWVFQHRNVWMVNHANIVVAVWDGSKVGGTWNCVKYAQDKRIPVWQINPSTHVVGWLNADETL